MDFPFLPALFLPAILSMKSLFTITSPHSMLLLPKKQEKEMSIGFTDLTTYPHLQAHAFTEGYYNRLRTQL